MNALAAVREDSRRWRPPPPAAGERLVRVDAPGGCCGGAVFARGPDGTWRCVAAAPFLGWWLHTPIENIRHFMHGPASRRGWCWVWYPVRGTP